MSLLHLAPPTTAHMESSSPDAAAPHAFDVAKQDIPQRLRELDDECPIENILETGAAVICAAALALGFAFDDRWYILPVLVSALLLQQVLQGWCPALPMLRSLGFRTAREIYVERHALEHLVYHCPFQIREQAVEPEPTNEPAPDTSCSGSFSLRQFLLTGAQ